MSWFANNRYPALGFICISGVLLANLVSIEVIAAMGSGGFLVAFAAVNFAAFRLSVTIGVERWIPVLGSALCLIAIVVLFSQVGRLELILFGLMIAVSVAIETIAQLQGRGMHIRHRPS